MMISDLQDELRIMSDEAYRDFHSRLIPNISKDTIIGVRTPVLRKYAKELFKRDDISEFLNDLPHRYYEENNLHGFIIEEYCNFDECIHLLEVFLPYIDNWATCDMLRPKCFSNSDNIDRLKEKALEWINSDKTYIKRYGVGVLLSYFLDENFDDSFLEIVSQIHSKEYYVNMMIAWFFATALAKQYRYAVKYIELHRLDNWVHNKTIQKAIESYRVCNEHKEYLRKLRV